MLEKDHFTRWMGMEVTDYADGYCKLHFTIRLEMLNGFGTVHGGILFSAADSAFAFACNSEGTLTVALDVTINFVKPAKEGDWLEVEAQKVHRGNKTGFYDVVVRDAEGQTVAIFRGTAFITNRTI